MIGRIYTGIIFLRENVTSIVIHCNIFSRRSSVYEEIVKCIRDYYRNDHCEL